MTQSSVSDDDRDCTDNDITHDRERMGTIYGDERMRDWSTCKIAKREISNL